LGSWPAAFLAVLPKLCLWFFDVYSLHFVSTQPTPTAFDLRSDAVCA